MEQEQAYKHQLEAWREEYFGAVYVMEIGDQQYIFRGLSRAEYKKSMDWYDDDYERAEYVCRQCVLHPEIDDYSEEIYAGVPEALVKEILRESGLTLSIKEMDYEIAVREQEMQTFDNQVSCIIKEAFPEIAIEDIHNWQFQKMMWYYVRAKWMLETFHGVSLEREEQANIPGLPPVPPIQK